MLNFKKPLELNFSDLDHLIQRKLLLFLKDEKINHDEYRKCSRGLSSIMWYMTIKEEDYSQ